MPFVIVKNPSQELLDSLLKEDKKGAGRPCPDCGVAKGKKHSGGCDVARCLSCGGQRLSCDCKEPGEDIWDGLWPGTRECYDKKYVAEWVYDGVGLPKHNYHTFDYNRLASEKAKAHSKRNSHGTKNE